ncbi:mannose-1-phosphate guanylyltransferase [Tuwongella immobilis]|uniref:mannose-1-phosphate guanylyltransferase n=1 Tax=Tuwongella immobilis TaxID=692036 RepID=A0A6C2YW83_9BACT|nr:mannose-1-phosphate guanylyltransferase [Tuwongella immobilis]VIP05714.1 mannose-1-phosphate guanylyltransferase : Mannose-1-phosphate guanylyltransferase OS=Rhodopirellula europaea SH398 GN=RESH_00048 PE=4 SV=1: NTP_transferase [Tuwongella immobilis]VTS08784.1 mannose-1-phosphate guanylyltransferase : Mannose-1-phosphate guanylyltransferase OS=Rhodopirellula europaea SH398 GN=RESH_00048 PE=4 SV=1: NTP_transferase [Tuwongella immobilis]
MLHAMIMAGGGGTRFWPRSRSARPKQFLRFVGDRTLLQGTRDRIESQVPAAQTWVLTAAVHAGEASAQLPELPTGNIVGEPFGRDTAACIGLGAALIARTDPDATMMVMPADHVIEPVQEFRRAAHAAEQIANDFPNALITFGIVPTYPSTGFGYIHRGPVVASRQNLQAMKVQAFREKPNSELAEQFLASGEYYWNSGIFVWKAATILHELAQQRPALHAAILRIADAWGTPEQEAVFRKEYEGLEKISIDYAVMEKAAEVLVLQAPFQWDDVGSWQALERRNPQDANGNTVLATHFGIDTNDSIIVCDEPGHLVTTIGVSNLLIVKDGDATLIADRRDEAAVKQLVEALKKSGREIYL